MKNAIPYIIIAGLVVVIFLMQQCESEPETRIIEVEVPAQTGHFEPEKPIHSEKDTVVKIVWKDKKIEVKNPINDSLEKAYREVSDSLQRWKMYVEAIQIRQYNQTFEDSLVKIDVFGKVQGDIQTMASNYTIKPRKVKKEINEKQTVFRLLAGAELGQNTEFSDFRYKLNLGFQNKKGNILNLGYSRQYGSDYIFLGYDFSILEIRK